MADTKLTELPPLSSTVGNDLFYVVSSQDIPSGGSYKITIGELFGTLNVPVNVTNTVTASSFIGGAITIDNINANTINANTINAVSIESDTISDLENIISELSFEVITNFDVLSSTLFLQNSSQEIKINSLSANKVDKTIFDSYKTNVASATATLLPITGGTITGGLTITNNLSTSVFITNLSTTKTFLSSDTCRVFHFNTTTQPLCAVFPTSLPNGFNVAVMNTGINNLRLSAAQLNSVGVVVGVQYGGAFIYKDNNQLFAVGRL
jgi:hypothetical protein